jgi:hypothetical protein
VLENRAGLGHGLRLLSFAMKTILVVAAGLLLTSGCATMNEPEPTNPVQLANETWQRNREMYYRSQGWSGPDAMFQAEQDLESGKSVPADRPPMERRPRD